MVLRPPRERPSRLLVLPPFCAGGAAVGLGVGRVLDHLNVGCVATLRQFPEQAFPRCRAPPSARSGYRSFSTARHTPGGQSIQRQPLLMTCTMPLITRRSSTRSLPRTSVGRSGCAVSATIARHQAKTDWARILSLRIKHSKRISNRFNQQRIFWVRTLGRPDTRSRSVVIPAKRCVSIAPCRDPGYALRAGSPGLAPLARDDSLAERHARSLALLIAAPHDHVQSITRRAEGGM